MLALVSNGISAQVIVDVVVVNLDNYDIIQFSSFLKAKIVLILAQNLIWTVQWNWRASLVQRFSASWDKRYGVIRRTCKGGKSCVPGLKSDQRRIGSKWNSWVTLIDSSWINLTKSCLEQIEFGREFCIFWGACNFYPTTGLCMWRTLCAKSRQASINWNF